MDNKSKKVFVGLSGGVDSSVAALLLQDAGYQVEGVFIKVWQPPTLKCSWPEDRLDAMRVCALLGIPFRTLDLSEEYKREVVDYMVSEYEAGRTPNPDIMCNKHIKFGKFLKYALSEGADFVATGHYARILNKDGKHLLMKGVDDKKDQSYFLWTLKEEDLKHILFPIGDLRKVDTRNLAKRFNLPTAVKSDSQGLCFLGEIDLKKFLGELTELTVGDVLDKSGSIIGEHDGALTYTIGQRHGFRINNKENREEPHFVVSKDISKNTITVSNSSPKTQTNEEIILERTNWINGQPNPNIGYVAKIRHQGEFLSCNISMDGKRVIFKDKIDALASGQSTVLYYKEVCIGGGVVK